MSRSKTLLTLEYRGNRREGKSIIFCVNRYENACRPFFNPISFIEKSRISFVKKIASPTRETTYTGRLSVKADYAGRPVLLVRDFFFPAFDNHDALEIVEDRIINSACIDFYSIRSFKCANCIRVHATA